MSQGIPEPGMTVHMQKKKLNNIDAANYIPLSNADILSQCIAKLKAPDIEKAKTFFKLVKNQIHLEFHQKIEELDQNYAPFNPNVPNDNVTADSSELAKNLKYSLIKANYRELGQEELDQAFAETSLLKIRLHVDFSDYKQTILYARGESIHKEQVALFGKFFKREIEFINYDSVVMLLHLKADIGDISLEEFCTPGSIVLKMFQNVPKADLEMLFPNTKIRMRLKDKFMIGIPALVSGIVIAVTKLGTSFILLGTLVGFWLGFSDEPVTLNKTSLLVLLAGFGTLGGYLWKQIRGFKNKKLEFTQKLTKNLYFRNLDNNEGVYYRLINEAEKEECKEVLLAYFYLLHSNTVKKPRELDKELEQWINETWGLTIDFDIEDAMEKLIRLELVKKLDDGFVALSLDDAIQNLDRQWDNYFVFKV